MSLSGEEPLHIRLAKQGVSRRDFLKFCGTMTTLLALPSFAPLQVAKALEASPRLPVIWLEFQDCAGDTESFLRAHEPSSDYPSYMTNILLELISLNYHETVMAAAGHQAEQSRKDTIAKYPGQYLVIVEGSIPTGEFEASCTIGGRTALDLVQETCKTAMATITVGTCAWDGGLAGASPSPTKAVGVYEAVPGLRNLVSLPGCPMNVVNLMGVITNLLTKGTLPDTDSLRRPLFAYGKRIHDQCDRQGHYNRKEFVEAWGDEGHRKGWCLFHMGCRGPKSYHNCGIVGWNDGTNWPVGSGHGCVGCASTHFWDRNTPIYATSTADLESNYSTGKPGSWFVLTATTFPVGEATISMKRPNATTYDEISRVTVDQSGRAVFVIFIPTNAPVGTYIVRMESKATLAQAISLAQTTSREVTLTIASSEQPRIERPADTTVPVIDAVHRHVHLPLIQR